MRYSHVIQGPPSPSDAGLIKLKAGPLKLHKERLPTSQHHRVRKASISTGTNTGSGSGSGTGTSTSTPPSSVDQHIVAAPPVKKVRSLRAPTEDAIIEVKSPVKPQPDKPLLPELKPWESYLHWLCLTEEPGTLWSSSLCATFHECLVTNPGAGQIKASEYAARIDDIYWSFYLPLDPLFQFMEDRILSGYLLHVWTMFIELGKRIPHDDPAQEKLVELLKELVHLPPMEVRTWEGNDAPWTDLPTLDDALIAAWDDLYDPEVQMSDPEGHWVNYFVFLGRLVSADVTPDWWEIPSITLKEVLAEDVAPNYLTVYKTMALAEYMNHAGDAFFEWCIDSGMLDTNASMSIISPLLETPVQRDWFDRRRIDDEVCSLD
ncbi:hypothetical protein J7T55_009800 [Diaporthe amygdali]|uniref:uncharacterized protein n=1 Tax=Phomopsis amygdali TaxID=1214568 RepID=UPI0022FDC196|nr:uncharacterized protein J7T55_009800 [Diaporthe amygdali]KAJ0116650.1 hypothetical protein J7T55_009800 [Diaporthe amygdali]